MDADDLFARLREETSTVHAEVERMVPLLGGSFTIAEYRAFLSTLWGFHRPIEHRLSEVAGLATVLPDWNRRRKSGLLAADLAALGVQAAALPVGDGWPALGSVDRAFGCLYVVEGSTLGGQYIHRHLSTALPLAARDASRFLTCYGADTGKMWRAFREHVAHATPSLDQDEVAAGARQTFIAVRDWFTRARFLFAVRSDVIEGRAP